MCLEEAASIDDLAILAKRRLPKFAFDFLDGGAGDEAGCRRNRASLQTILLKPHYGLGLDP
ncbi:MAG TPA: alpha-hydroxy-acid oxidizing protein, partial [Rhodospirillaceae bacterium]|nr:alpha-hydroxy-acid oxidizing protein [Rhodospirillaceae bacterium]